MPKQSLDSQAPVAPPAGPRIAYVVERWPNLSTTFIHNELCVLVEEGLDVQIWALAAPPTDAVQPLAPVLAARTRYFPPTLVGMYLRAHLRMAATAPGRYLRTFFRTLAMYRKGPYEWLRGLAVFYQAVLVAQWCRRQGIEHVHAHFAGRQSAVACASYWLTDIPFSFTAHAGMVYRAGKQLLSRLRDAAFVVAISEHMRQTLLEISDGRWADKIHVIHLGVRPEQLVQAEVQPNDTPVILAVGRLSEEKGLAYLVEACSQLKEQDLAFRCHIIGDGPQRDTLHSAIRHYDLQNEVTLLGPLPHAAVMQHMASADLVVLPSIVTADLRSDGIPTVLAEAMGSGVAVIATSVGGIPELVRHGETGLLVSQRSAGELAQAIALLLQQPEYRRQLALTGQQHVRQHFDLTQNARQLAQRFRKSVAQHAGLTSDNGG